jgi:hypothetical protein
VRETAGQTLTFNGSPIDAFFLFDLWWQTPRAPKFVGANGPISSRCDEDENGQVLPVLSRFRWR